MFNGLNQIICNNKVYDGTFQGTYIASKGGARNTLIYGNEVHLTQTGYVAANNWSAGAILIGGQGGSYWDPLGNGYNCYNCVAWNNVVINETTNPHAPGLGFQASINSVFLNNVVIGAQLFAVTDGGGPTTHGTSLSRSTTSPVFLNNIVTATGPGATQLDVYGGFNGWTFSGVATVDYNNFFGFSGTVFSQPHAITGDPLFITPVSDWHLRAGSPALGTALMMPTTPAFGGGTIDTSRNKDGVPRTTPWSLGVY